MTNYKGKHFIAEQDWTKAELDHMFEVAHELKEKKKKGEITDWLKNQTVFMIFFEQSTRTRNSMGCGITQLGGNSHDLTPDKMQLSHGETAKERRREVSGD